ncbi:WD repeat-containing protein CG11141 [Leptopilina boulardi]|uniref:WD repeat-containing protein CG11141 n=1 Tax=Leptopilina boulardi TaxID=63433 RepID=UPI0021F52B41|nr:WD repeat-containing protein CG11141 [Leptopilina boulardi]XP_051156639.1 WD repeat-containing protein CG11141 [Leptopilina boulardi]
MSTPMSEDSGVLREWAPLATLLQRLPAKIQNGLFSQNINFTCIDVLPEFIAIGTNHGLVYWFNRESGEIQKLRCENLNTIITCIRVISTVDYMVAVGNDQGIVTVFQIPKQPPDSLPESLKPKQKKQVERYNIAGLHKSTVTAVDWSKNGMKLFSGDQDGLVVFTEIDFYMHLSKSSELLNEKYSIVQLSYQQGLLLVSTLFRTILVNLNEKGKVMQVGQKERKILGKLGAVFGNRISLGQEPIIYASRPGLRLWQADKNGTVLKTLMFKDAIRFGHSEVELLNPAQEITRKSRGEPTFGIILPFSDDLLITYSDDIIYVVNPITISITSAITDVRHVTDVACTKDEIFILEGERNIIRVAYHPENNSYISNTDSMMDSISLAQISKPVTTGILELTSKLKESSIVPAIPFHKINPTNIIQAMGVLPSVTIGTDTTSIINAEEALEIPPIVPLELETPLVTDNDSTLRIGIETCQKIISFEENEKRNDRRRIFEKIAEQEFEDVVFTPERRNKKSVNKINGFRENNSSNNKLKFNNGVTTQSSLLTLSIDNDMLLKSDRNLDSIQKDVENKEKLLADVLNFDLSEYMTSSRLYPVDTNILTSIDAIPYDNCSSSSVNGNDDECLDIKQDIEEQDEITDCTETESVEEDASYKTELKKLEDLGECSKILLQSKLSEFQNNNVDIGVEPPTSNIGVDSELQFNDLSRDFVSTIVYEEKRKDKDNEDWVFVSYP